MDDEEMEDLYSSDEENSMEVDWVEPENLASNVVTRAKVNDGILALGISVVSWPKPSA
jgi:predicted HTH transcriptional regulator